MDSKIPIMSIKGNILKTTVLAVATFLVVENASSQQSPQWPTSYETATITTDYCVTLDATKAISEFYKIDITALNFATESDAKKVFGAISNNLLSYQVDFANGAAYLHVHLNRTKNPEDITWWNNYIQGLCN
jgi:hypothetical protein